MYSAKADHDQWEAARANLITASDVSRLLCEAPADSEKRRAEQRAQLIMEKAGLADRWSGNETTELAKFLEPGVIDAGRALLGWDLRRHGELTTDRECPRLGATPDSIMPTPCGWATVNVKVSACQTTEDCKPKSDGTPSGAAFAHGVPLYYQIQLQALKAGKLRVA
jgi:hypothetical protein